MTDTQSIALLWVNFGPYHDARLQQLRKLVAVDAVEFAAEQQLYGWRKTGAGGSVMTLWDGPSETAPWITVIRRLIGHLNRTRPMVLLIPGYVETGALAAAAWGRALGRVNVLMADSTVEDQVRTWWKEKLKGWVIRLMYDRAMVSGSRAADYLGKLGFRGRPMAYHYDVVDNDYFARETDLLRKHSTPGDSGLPDRYFLYVGRLAVEKNIEGLLRAFRRYRGKGGKWSLVLVGKGPLTATVAARAKDLTDDAAVVFAGYRTYEEMPSYYAFAQAFVIASISEPWGLVVNEAMASGLPVMVSRCCGCVDDLVEEGRNGFVLDPTDEDALADSLLRMERLSENDRAAMSRRSREIIAAYSPEAWAREVVRIVSNNPAEPWSVGEASDRRLSA